MSIKITIPNTSSDVLTFGSANTPTAAQIAGIDSGSSNGQLALYTTASGTSTERVRVDASGNVGINTSSPATKLNLGGSADQTFQINGSGTAAFLGTSTAVAQFSSNRNPTTGAIYDSGRAVSYINLEASSGNGNIQFYTTATNNVNATERARIDSSGNIRIGNTTGGSRRMQVESASANFTIGTLNTNAAPYSYYAEYSTSPNNTGSNFFQAVDSTTIRCDIRSNGGIANYTANDVNLSDRREKTNFAPAKSYLQTICAIPVQTFNYIDQNHEEDPGLTLGVVAQDVQEVAPELVMESNWGTQEKPKMRLSIYQTDLQYALMKCIQEMKAIIDTQASTITQLQADVAALKAQP
jgi:hypothetical protein